MMKKFSARETVSELAVLQNGPAFWNYVEESLGRRIGSDMVREFKPEWTRAGIDRPEYLMGTTVGQLDLMVGTVDDFHKALKQARDDGNRERADRQQKAATAHFLEGYEQAKAEMRKKLDL